MPESSTKSLANAIIDIRSARPDDAEALLNHLKTVLAEDTVMIPKRPEDVTLSVEQEYTFLTEFLAHPQNLFLVACAHQQIIGNLDYHNLKRPALAHTAVLGMAIQADWRGKGVGSLLMQAGLDWAIANPKLKRLELFVYAENLPAIALYQKFGFVIEGRRKGVVKYQNQYVDDLVMARWLD